MPEESAEEINEVALEAVTERAEKPEAPWIKWAALSTMIMALFSAFGSMLAGRTANEALIHRQMQLSELLRLNRMELQSEVLLTRLAVLQSIGREPPHELKQKIRETESEADDHSEEAVEDVGNSKEALEVHEMLSLANTILSTAITLIGMSVIVHRRHLWLTGLVVGSVGAALVLINASAAFAT